MSKEKILSSLIILYKCLFILVTFVSAVPYLHEIISPYVKILLGMGFLLLAGDFILGRKVWKSRYIYILLAFALSYLITIILNRSGHFSENMKAWFYMIQIFLLIYGYDISKGRKQYEKETSILLHTFLAGAFIAALICFITYLFSYNITYQIGESKMYIGMYDNRLWGLYNPNTGATLNVVSIIISLIYLFRESKNWIAKILYVINMLLQGICLILTSSRAPIVLCVFCVGIFAGVEVSRYVKNKKEKSPLNNGIRKAFMGTASALCLVIVLALGGTAVQNGLAYLPPMLKTSALAGPVVLKDYYASLQTAKKNASTSNQKKVDLTRKEKEETRKGGILTGRGDLWQAGIEGFAKAPVFGVGRENIYDKCQGYLEDKVWQASLQNGGLHNIFLTVLVSSGIVGFVILIIFIVLTFKDILVYGFRKKGFVKNRTFLGCVLILVAFAGMEMLEARILYQVGIFYIIFWMIYGAAMNSIHLEKEENK